MRLSGLSHAKDYPQEMSEPLLTETLNPVVKWPGGKRQLMNKIIPILKSQLLSSSHYFEPFVGGGAICFGLRHPHSTMSDINEGLINLYRNIRDAPEELITQVQKLEFEYNALEDELQKEFFYKKREEFNLQKREGMNSAVNFLFLNKTCFNGMYRENKSGGFNVPFGKRHDIRIMDELNVRNLSTFLMQTPLLNVSYQEAISEAKAGDLVYFDPPYVPMSVTSSFTSYSSEGFGPNEQEKLSESFKELDGKGVKVALSNSESVKYLNLYSGYQYFEFNASRNLSAKAQGRASVKEVLITNFNYEEAGTLD